MFYRQDNCGGNYRRDSDDADYCGLQRIGPRRTNGKQDEDYQNNKQTLTQIWRMKEASRMRTD